MLLQIDFPVYPALCLRLRAGLNSAALTALDFRPSSPLANYVWFSQSPEGPPYPYERYVNVGMAVRPWAHIPTLCITFATVSARSAANTVLTKLTDRKRGV